jgi:hypothetical protein
MDRKHIQYIQACLANGIAASTPHGIDGHDNLLAFNPSDQWIGVTTHACSLTANEDQILQGLKRIEKAAQGELCACAAKVLASGVLSTSCLRAQTVIRTNPNDPHGYRKNSRE